MVLSQAEKYENRLKKQIEEYEIKDKAQRKQDRLLNDRNNLMNERERKQDERELRNILVKTKKHTTSFTFENYKNRLPLVDF
jgi:Fe-S cluster biosynthesis and repair protein YggX